MTRRIRSRVSRRGMLRGVIAAGVAPWFVPAGVLGADGQTPPSGKLNLGVIGVGAQGQQDMRAFMNHQDLRVRAICDINQRNVASAKKIIADAYGSPDVKVYADFRQLNADPAIDAVLMALPVHWHSIPATDAILNGKHIYHEKPMAMSFDEAKVVRDAVRKKGVVFQFGTQQRSDMRFRWACELALNGRLGKMKEIQVSVPAGKQSEELPEQGVPDYVDWDKWVGPAPQTAFHSKKLVRDWHENITSFSLGMISCWGIHHLDIAQWGNDADKTGPASVEGTGQFPAKGTCDAILNWKVRFEYAGASPITFVNDGAGFDHGIRFIGDAAQVLVLRGSMKPSAESLLRDPQNKCGQMPIKLPVSIEHTRNFLDAIKSRSRAICDIETAVRADTLCQLALIAVKTRRKLQWDARAEQFVQDDAANELLRARPMRGSWALPRQM